MNWIKCFNKIIAKKKKNHFGNRKYRKFIMLVNEIKF